MVLPNDGLISGGARERWARWQHDLQMAELTERQEHPARYQADRVKAYFRRAMPNPAQALSMLPSVGDSLQGDEIAFSDALYNSLRSQETQAFTSPVNLNWSPPEVNGHEHGVEYIDGAPLQMEPSSSINNTAACDYSDSSNEDNPTASIGISMTGSSADISIVRNGVIENEVLCNPGPSASGNYAGTDQISDTVGAIAVDCHGNIAAGSSSGGIGMKHRGRIGPAALVGIGTAVIPVDPNDPDRTSVASVTSGTGEHIATTLAASTCASRVYHNERKAADGAFEEVTEDEAIRAMIDSDFMGKWFFYCVASEWLILPGHPGVRTSHCQGAIGIMTVKKTAHGVYLYFGHNTDSFVSALNAWLVMYLTHPGTGFYEQ